MIAATHDFVEIAVAVNGSVGMGRPAELLEDQPRLGGRRSRGAVGMGRQLGKHRPHGARLEGHDDLGTRLAAHAVDDGKVAVEQSFVEHVTRCGQLGEIDHAVFRIFEKVMQN